MFKRVLRILIAGIFIFGMNKLSFAMMCDSEGEHSSQKHLAQAHTEHEQGATKATKDKDTETKESVNVGNKICPVSGEKIDEKTKATYEYQGKIYNFCCPACIESFKKDPEKYIKKVEEEFRHKDSHELKKMKMPEEDEMPMGMHGHKHHDR
ncbi:MAG: YHS domain-containing protein [Candidatus Omnitrophota bacterium]